MRQLAEQKKVVERWRGVEKEAADAAELIALEDESMAAEIEAEVDKLASRLDAMELERAFSGDYDQRNAILSIHAGFYPYTLALAAPNRRTGRRC